MVYCVVDYVQMCFDGDRLQRVIVGETTTMSTFSFPNLFLNRQKVAAFLNRASPRPGSTSRCLAKRGGLRARGADVVLRLRVFMMSLKRR